jgi:hypothetical protein
VPWAVRLGVLLGGPLRPQLWVLGEPWKDGGEWVKLPCRAGPCELACRPADESSGADWLDRRLEGSESERWVEAGRLRDCPAGVPGCVGWALLRPPPACELAQELAR